MRKKIGVLRVGKGQKPRLLHVCPTELSQILGNGKMLWVPIAASDSLPCLFLLMVVREKDYHAMIENGDFMPRRGVICGLDFNDLVSVIPPARRILLRDFRIKGDMALYADQSEPYECYPPPVTGNAAHQRKRKTRSRRNRRKGGVSV